MDNLKNDPLRRVLLYTSFVVLSVLTIQACDDDDDPTSPTEDNIVEVAQSDSNFTSLVPRLEQSGLSATLEGEGPFTVFAPTNVAFNNLPDGFLEGLSDEQLADILSYHVVQNEIASGDFESEQTIQTLEGEELFVTTQNDTVNINDIAIFSDADIEASNGIIHSIDQVLLPDGYSNAFLVIDKRYTLDSLEQVIRDAGFESTLQQDTPDGYTIFAPDNEAFGTLPEDTLSGLNEEELQNLLTYHVLSNTLLSSELADSQTIETLNGDSLVIEITDETVTVTDNNGNTYQVTTADLEATNGVVHIINGVLIPNSD